MGIHELTVKRQIERILQGFYKEGRVPRSVELETKINEFFKKYPPGRPRLQLRPQARRSRFDLSAFNAQSDEILQDLDLLYAALVDTIEQTSKQVALGQGTISVFDRQLNALGDDLNSLILTTKGAGGHLYSITESFNTLANIDTANTTATVDLDSQICTLRRMQRGSGRIGIQHMLPRSTTDVGLRPLITPLTEKTVLVAETAFSNALSSISDQAFMLTYKAPTSPVRIRIEFRLPPDGIETLALSRIDLKPVGEFNVDVFYTNENREERSNWLRFPGLERSVRLTRKESLRFESRQVAWLRLELTKSAQDKETIDLQNNVNKIFQFGLETLEFYSYGYASESILQTNSLVPIGASGLSSVGKVTLDVEERPRPVGTDIKYFVQLDETDSPWVEINPVNRPATAAAPNVVDFGGSIRVPRSDSRVRLTSPTVYNTRNAIDFYALTTLPHSPVYGTAQLFPTIGCWKESLARTETTSTVSGNYLVFTSNDNAQELYLSNRDEEATVRSVSDLAYLDLSHTVLVQDGMPLVAPINQAIEQNPVFSIERVLRINGADVPSGSSAVISRVIGQRPEVNLGTAVANQANYEGQYIFLRQTGGDQGYFRIYDSYTDASSNTVFVLDSVGTLEGSSIYWVLSTENVSDHVKAVRNRTVETDLTYRSTDRFLITYRYVLERNQHIVEGSVRVRIAGGVEVEEGRDFKVDYLNRSIQRLEGRIGYGSANTISATVDFQLREVTEELNLYTTYATLRGRRAFVVEPISIDKPLGEYVKVVHVSGNSRIISDAAAGGEWTLDGVVQFVVQSKPLTRPDGTVDTTSAIYKTINLTDINGADLFSVGAFFDRIEAVVEPLEQTTLTKLQSMSPVDHSHFAVLSDNRIVTNYNPLDQTDVFVLLPGQTVKQTYVDMETSYSYKPTATTTNAVKLRAVFTRDAGTDGTVTPVIDSFTIRYS